MKSENRRGKNNEGLEDESDGKHGEQDGSVRGTAI